MKQAWVVVWAQWRSFRNYSSGGRAVLATIMTTLWYLGWAGGAMVIGAVMADPDTEEVFEVLPAALMLMFLYWQVVPLMMAATGASLDLRKLKAYPIAAGSLFLVEVLLRVTAGLEMLLILTGASIGILLNPAIPAWAALAAVPFTCFNLLLALGVRDIVVRLMSKRRMREVAALIFILMAAVPQFLLRDRENGVERWFESWSLPSLPPILPWTATANVIRGQEVPWAVLTMLVWCAAAGAFAAWQYRRTLAFDAEAAAASGSRGGVRATLLDRIYGIPSALFPDPIGAMVEKEVRHLARSPRFRMLFIMGCVFGLFIARTLVGSNSEGRNYWGPDYLTAVSVYSLLLLGEVCFWNSFGFDRAAAQIYFLAPIPFTRALIAKNISAILFVSLAILLAVIVCLLIGIPLSLRSVAESFAVAAVASPLLLAAGNFMSVRNPRGLNPQDSMRAGASGRTQGLLLLVYPAAFLPVSLAYIARWLFRSELVFFAVLAVIGVMVGIVYKIGLDSAARQAMERREAMISALSQGQGPVAT